MLLGGGRAQVPIKNRIEAQFDGEKAVVRLASIGAMRVSGAACDQRERAERRNRRRLARVREGEDEDAVQHGGGGRKTGEQEERSEERAVPQRPGPRSALSRMPV
jgi:hypothetical protein